LALASMKNAAKCDKVMWIAEFSESSNLWTHLALSGIPESTPVRVSWNSQAEDSLSLFGSGLCCVNAAGLKCISWSLWPGVFGSTQRDNYLTLRTVFGLARGPSNIRIASNCALGPTFDYLTSNQVGLPAELKHINKRRKRN